MTTHHSLADSYVRATNDHDPAAFLALFAENAVVDDAGRQISGRNAIKNWSDSDIFGVNVRLEVQDIVEREGETVVTTKVDGTFDRTGLPDPLYIDHHFSAHNGQITSLKCRLKT